MLAHYLLSELRRGGVLERHLPTETDPPRFFLNGREILKADDALLELLQSSLVIMSNSPNPEIVEILITRAGLQEQLRLDAAMEKEFEEEVAASLEPFKYKLELNNRRRLLQLHQGSFLKPLPIQSDRSGQRISFPSIQQIVMIILAMMIIVMVLMILDRIFL